jgi:uracil-DNA glycosylase family 4
MFTGDQSGDWLFRALHGAGLATQAASTHRGDALRLIDCAISAVCHCAPPDNKPAVEEIVQCRPWLEQTMRVVRPRIILALGHIGWNSVIQYAKSQNWLTVRGPRFAHGHCVNLTREITLLGSYHPSQQNTFTGRLTERMLNDIMRTARDLIDKARNERLGRGELPSVITDPRIEKSLE